MARNMLSNYPLDMPRYNPTETLIKSFTLAIEDKNGRTFEIFNTDNNYQRLFRLNKKIQAKTVRLSIQETRQEKASKIFAFDFSYTKIQQFIKSSTKA